MGLFRMIFHDFSIYGWFISWNFPSMDVVGCHNVKVALRSSWTHLEVDDVEDVDVALWKKICVSGIIIHFFLGKMNIFFKAGKVQVSRSQGALC